MSTVSYIDSNVFVYAVLYDDARGQACRQLLTRLVDGEFTAVTSVLTWDEFSYVVERHAGRDVAVSAGERFLRFPGLTLIPCTPALLAAAQGLRASTSLRPRDCLHVATARQAAASGIISEDTDLDGIPDLPRLSPVD